MYKQAATKLRLFDKDHLFRVTRYSQFKVYQYALTRKREVVFVPDGWTYLSPKQLGQIDVHLNILEACLNRKLVTIEEIGENRTLEMRMKYTKWARTNGVPIEGEPDERDLD